MKKSQRGQPASGIGALDAGAHNADTVGVRRVWKLFATAMVAAVFAAASPWGTAAALPAVPFPGLAPAKARDAVTLAAVSALGSPYRLGGEDRSGFDCSGLVYFSFLQATGKRVPRTVETQLAWTTPIKKASLLPGDLVFFASDGGKKADHVGIYLGDGRFIHSASTGAKRGVTIDSLGDSTWARHYIASGRALPASGLAGLILETGIQGIFDEAVLNYPELRGAGLSLSLLYPLGTNFEVGLRARAIYDTALGAARLPLEVTLGQRIGLSIFAGPALTIGSPSLPASDGSGLRSYQAVAYPIASAGLRWSPGFLKIGRLALGLYTELRFDRLKASSGLAQDLVADRRAQASFSVGFNIRGTVY